MVVGSSLLAAVVVGSRLLADTAAVVVGSLLDTAAVVVGSRLLGTAAVAGEVAPCLVVGGSTAVAELLRWCW